MIVATVAYDIPVGNVSQRRYLMSDPSFNLDVIGRSTVTARQSIIDADDGQCRLSLLLLLENFDMSTLIRARTWTARTPQELMMDRDMYRYEAEQDRLKREMKRDTRRLNRIYSDAADSRMAAANAMRMSSRYDHDYRNPLLGHGMYSFSVPPYGMGQGMLASPMASRRAMDRRVAVETLRTQRAMDMLSLQERQQQRELLRVSTV